MITGMVVTMDAQRHIYDDGAVVVNGDTIVAVGPRAEIEAGTRAARPSMPGTSWYCQDSSTVIPTSR